MKFFLVLSVFISATLLANGQSSGGASGQQSKARGQARKSATQLRGTGQYHGSKDTTPGSPMGTGGAGGNELSGSQAGSASETAIQSGKENVQAGDQTGSQGSGAAKKNMKKKRAMPKNRRI